MLYGYRCVQTNIKTQGFGENKLCIKNGKFLGADRGKCPEGYKGYYTGMGMLGHNGTDWKIIYSEPVFHSWGFYGYVRTQVDFAGAIGVDVLSKDPVELIDGSKVYVMARYWHHHKLLVSDGDLVKPGDALAFGDSTGASTGHHVHESLKVVEKANNPNFKVHQNYFTTNKGNGYFGAINPEPYFTNEFIGKVVRQFSSPQSKSVIIQRKILEFVRFCELGRLLGKI